MWYWYLYKKMKNKKRNFSFRGIGYLGAAWTFVVGISTIGGAIYSSELIKGYIWKPKKRFYEIYDDDVIDETNTNMTNAIKNGVELDYEETLNKLQELKNIKKINKKDD